MLANVAENRELWLKLRSSTVGSSEISTIMGLNKHQTPLQLWAQKTGRLASTEDNDFMRLGRLMEQFIGEKFSRDTELQVAPADALYCHNVHQQFTASPDFWVLKPTNYSDVDISEILECKNVNYRLADQWEDGNCPDHAQIQLQWQLGVCGLPSGYVAGLVGAQVRDFHHVHFEYDPVVVEQCFEAAYQFLQFVKTDTPPAATAGDRQTIESQMELNPTETRLPDSSLSLLEQYEEIYLQRTAQDALTKELKNKEDSLRAQIEQLMQEHSAAHCGSYTVKAKRINRGSYTVKASSYVNFSLLKEGKKL